MGSNKCFLFTAFFFLALFNKESFGQSIYKQYNIYRNPITVALNKVALTVSWGYSTTNFEHSLEGFYLYQTGENQFILPKLSNGAISDIISGQSDWLNSPKISPAVNIGDSYQIGYNPIESPVNNLEIDSDYLFIDGDSTAINFRSFWSGIPINIVAHHDFNNFRFGMGVNFEKLWSKPLAVVHGRNHYLSYHPNFKSTDFLRAFGILGYKFYSEWNYAVVGEVMLGKIWSSSEFDDNQINRSLFYNLGLNFEYHFSEYLRLIVKPSYEIKDYVVNVPSNGSENLTRLTHRYNSLTLQMGISINIPEINRSPLKEDHVQLKHVITHPATGRLEEVRGQLIWKVQNPKIGQNHRKLIQYKRKNRKNSNPF